LIWRLVKNLEMRADIRSVFFMVVALALQTETSTSSRIHFEPTVYNGLIALRGGADEQKFLKSKSKLLRYWLNDEGNRVYTVCKIDPFGRPTYSAYPPDFSPG
jgi:hypothetical protein